MPKHEELLAIYYYLFVVVKLIQRNANERNEGQVHGLALGGDADLVRIRIHKHRGHSGLSTNGRDFHTVNGDGERFGPPVPLGLADLDAVDTDGSVAVERVEHTGGFNGHLVFIGRSANVDGGGKIKLFCRSTPRSLPWASVRVRLCEKVSSSALILKTTVSLASLIEASSPVQLVDFSFK